MNKPIDLKTHGIIDYAFSGLQLFAPTWLGLNRAAINLYKSMGMEFFLVNALTKSPVGLIKRLSFRDHQKADSGFLVGLAALTSSKIIREDKKALWFHLGFMAIAATSYLLTDYEGGEKGELN